MHYILLTNVSYDHMTSEVIYHTSLIEDRHGVFSLCVCVCV